MDTLKLILKADRSDKVGAISAMICLVHCVLSPVLFGTMVDLHGHEASFLFFKVDYLFLAIGLYAVWHSTRHDIARWLKVMLWGSYALLAVSVLFEGLGEWLTLSLYVSSTLLIVAHIINIGHFRKHLIPQGS